LPESYLDFEVKETTLEEEEKISGVSDEEMIEQMQICLVDLKENQRVCVELFYLKNQSYQQICDKTNFSLNEVKSFIQNGKRNLKLLLEQRIKNRKHAG
jgi:RNA polymerase sigma-70 factor (ECF subfamily)